MPAQPKAVSLCLEGPHALKRHSTCRPGWECVCSSESVLQLGH
jgi:hypothetical protein